MPVGPRGGSLFGAGVVFAFSASGMNTFTGIQANMRKLDKTTQIVSSSLGQMAVISGALAAKFAAIGLAASAGFGLAILAAANFEEQLFNVRKTTDGTMQQVMALGKQLVTMSMDMPIASKELGEIAAIGGQLGLNFSKGGEDLRKFTDIVAKMATVTVFTSDKAARALAELSNVFRIDIQDVDKLGATMNKLTNISTANVEVLFDVTSRLGGTARAMGITADQALALATAARAAGLTTQIAGTNIPKILVQMTRSTAAFATHLGVSTKKFKEMFNKDAAGVFRDFLGSFKDMSSFERSKTLDKLGLVGQGVIRVVNNMSGSIDQLDRFLKAASHEFREATSLEEEFKIFTQSLNKQVLILINRFKAIGIKIGMVFIPLVKTAVKIISAFTKAISVLPTPILGLIGAILLLTGVTFSFVAIGAAMLSVLSFLSARTGLASLNVLSLSASIGLLNKSFFTTFSLTQRILTSLPLMAANFVKTLIKTKSLSAASFELSRSLRSQIKLFKGSGVIGAWYANLLNTVVTPATVFLQNVTSKGLVFALRTAAKGFIGFAKVAIAQIAKVALALVSSGWGLILLGIGLLFAAIMTNVAGLRDTLSKDLGPAFESIGATFRGLWDVAKALFGGMVKIIVTVLLPVIFAIAGVFEGAIKGIQSFVAPMFDAFKGMIEAFSEIGSFISDIFGAKGLGGGMGILEGIKTVLSVIVKALFWPMAQVSKLIASAWMHLFKWVISSITALRKFFGIQKKVSAEAKAQEAVTATAAFKLFTALSGIKQIPGEIGRVLPQEPIPLGATAFPVNTDLMFPSVRGRSKEDIADLATRRTQGTPNINNILKIKIELDGEELSHKVKQMEKETDRRNFESDDFVSGGVIVNP